jgi:hypothetical protein
MDIKTMIKQSFTGADNATIDIGRILWVLGGLTFLCCAIYSIYKGQNWDAVAFGTGFGAVLAGGGAALGFKKGTEPPACNHKDDDRH